MKNLFATFVTLWGLFGISKLCIHLMIGKWPVEAINYVEKFGLISLVAAIFFTIVWIIAFSIQKFQDNED